MALSDRQQTLMYSAVIRSLLLAVLVALLCCEALEAELRAADPANRVSARSADVPQVHPDPRITILPVVDGSGIRFARLSTENGLSQTRVSQIIQDDQGFMWFGTQYGLNRYDGYKFKVFKHESGIKNSLSGVYVYSLFKDHSGALWVGCDESLDRFDPVTETFTHYRVDPEDPQTVPVNNISEDHTGMLWLATSRGLYKFDAYSGRTIRYRHEPSDPSSLSSSSIKSTGEDKRGNFWVATDEGLDQFDPGSAKVTLHIPLRERGEMSFYEDRFGTFWIIHVTGSGLATFDPKTNRLRRFTFSDRKLMDKSPTGVVSMVEDKEGTLWLGTLGDGLLQYDRKRERFIRFRNQPSDPESLAQDSLRVLFRDREGNVWVGLYMMAPSHFFPKGGHFQAFKHEFGNRNSLSETMVNTIYEDRHNTLWIGSTGALNRIDLATGKYSFLRLAGPGINTEANTIVEDRAGLLWIGTSGHGLSSLDQKTGTIRTYRHSLRDSYSLSSDLVTRLLIDHNGTLWAATIDGLDRFDAEHSRFVVYRYDQHLGSLIYMEIKEDPKGVLWIGTHSSGLLRFDPKTGVYTSYRHDANDPTSLSDNRVNSVHFDPSGTMWVGTENGLDRFDPRTGTFRSYYASEGLPDNLVSCVLSDKQGNLWLGTNNGLSTFDPLWGTFKNFTVADGLPGTDLTGWGACYKDANGRMFFGGFSGGVAFYPEDVIDTTYIPQVVLTDFRLFGRPVGIGASSPLSESIGYTKVLTLSHDENIFSLEFAVLSYFNSATNRYRYKLDGLDHDWHNVGSDQRTVMYTTLPAGWYTFHIQGATIRGAWGEPGISLPIHILPAWWNRWWFRTFYIAAALLALFGFYRYRLHQLAEAFKGRMEERIMERTRIARELHDTLLQSFYGLVLSFEAAISIIPPEMSAHATLKSMLARADKALAEGRDRVYGLRMSTDDLQDLSARIGALLEEMKNVCNAIFTLRAEGSLTEYDPEVCGELYQIAREALMNAALHSGATAIVTSITASPISLLLEVSDNGRGIDEELLLAGGKRGHWGMVGMRERARQIGSEIRISSIPGKGTTVSLEVPRSYEKRKSAPTAP